MDYIQLSAHVYAVHRGQDDITQPLQLPISSSAENKIVTTRSQVLPDPNWEQAVNASIVEQAEALSASEQSVTIADSRPTDSQPDWQGAPPPSLPPPLASTPAPPAARRLDQANARNFIQELEQSIFPLEETCKKCGEKVNNTDELQDHIISKHCLQYPELVKLIEEQRVVLSCLVKEQNKQTIQLTDIALTQTCIVSDVKQLKRQYDNTAPPPVSAAPSRPLPAPTAVQRTLAAPPAPCPRYAPSPSQESVSPLVTYAGMAGREAGGQGRNAGREAAGQGRNVTAARKIAYITDSIGGNVYLKELEKLTKTKIKKAKAYGATKRERSEGFLFPDRNFTDVVPAVLSSEQPDVVIATAPSVELTNLPLGAVDEYASQEASCSSYNMVKVAENALTNNPGLKMFIIPERVPRYDRWNELNNYANEELHEAVKQVNNKDVRKRILIGRHNLECEGGLRVSRYGDPRTCRRTVDNIHMRGSSGTVAFTRSMASILAGAGFCSSTDADNICRSEENRSVPAPEFQQVQRGRQAAATRQQPQFLLSTANRFGVLEN